MIPVVSIGNLISFVVSLAAASRLYFSYRRTKEAKVNDFFKAFLFLAVYMGLLATPELVFKNPKIIELVSLEISLFFGYLCIAYLTKIPLEILHWEKLKKIYFQGLIVFGLLITLINVVTIQPAVYHSQGQFVFWEDNRGLAINLVSGFVFGIGAISSALFFFIGGLKAEDKHIKTRAFIITGGLFIMTVAAFINYIFGASPQSFLSSVAASFLVAAGTLILLAGVYYKFDLSH